MMVLVESAAPVAVLGIALIIVRYLYPGNIPVWKGGTVIEILYVIVGVSSTSVCRVLEGRLNEIFRVSHLSLLSSEWRLVPLGSRGQTQAGESLEELSLQSQGLTPSWTKRAGPCKICPVLKKVSYPFDVQ